MRDTQTFVLSKNFSYGFSFLRVSVCVYYRQRTYPNKFKKNTPTMASKRKRNEDECEEVNDEDIEDSGESEPSDAEDLADTLEMDENELHQNDDEDEMSESEREELSTFMTPHAEDLPKIAAEEAAVGAIEENSSSEEEEEN